MEGRNRYRRAFSKYTARYWRAPLFEEAHASPGAFLAHAAKILAKALSDEGVPYIQLDAPSHWGDPALKAKYERLFNELKNPFHLKPAALYDGSMRLHDTCRWIN